MKKQLFPLLLVLALLDSCAATPAEPWTPDETPEAREARILATAAPCSYEIEAEVSGDESWKRLTGYLCVLLTARDPERSAVFGGAFLDEQAGRYVVYTTEDVWNHSELPYTLVNRCYYLDEIPTEVPLDIAICDFTLAELGATARELEALALPGILDIRVEPRQNRVAVYAETWSEKRQAELEEKLTHPEHCAVTLDPPPDGETVRFAERWMDTDAAAFATQEAAFGELYRAAERVYNAWWWLPAGSWQKPLCDQDPNVQYQGGCGRHANLIPYPAESGAWLPVLDLCRVDANFTPAWEEWTPEHEAFFRHLLAGLEITVCHYDEGYNAIVPL